jgi:hypothetical protein
MTDDNIFSQATNSMKGRKKETQLSIGFLNCAKEDFESAKILYGHEIYSLAIYHLQQCVEKIWKSFLLFNGII